jgi:hypothetical protein
MPATPTPAQGSTSSPSGAFYVAGGQIIGLSGSAVLPVGIAIMYDTGGANPTVSQVQALFPGISYIRLAMYNYVSDQSLGNYVASFTSAGIIVNIEDHQSSDGTDAGGGTGVIFTGSLLTQELNWYSAIAAMFASNPYVWFSTDNEPSETDASGNTNASALSDWQLATYNAIRNAGNNNPIMLETTVWSTTQINVGYNVSDYSGMKNVIWDQHIYPWLFNGASDAGTITSDINAIVAGDHAITSADGVIPVFFGEFGNSTTGASADANGAQVVQGVLNETGYGFAAWMWCSGPYDCLLGDSSGNSLSSYGQQVAAEIAARK